MSEVWRPNAAQIPDTQIYKFMQYVNNLESRNIKSYQELYQYSIAEADFWLRLSEFLRIIYAVAPTRTIISGSHTLDTTSLYPPPKFFPDARLNYAENCLESRKPYHTAVITVLEGAKNTMKYTFADLKNRVHRLADALRHLGIRKGDIVAGVLSNSIYSVTLLLAATSLGAVYSASAPDMGVSGIVDRLVQVKPKIVFFDNATYYNLKHHELLNKAKTVLERIDSPSLAAFVIVPNVLTMDSTISLIKSCSLAEFLDRYPNRSRQLSYEPVRFTGK